ncbi:response regulator transcription factor [Streptomyces sp. VRA16 Mangrove soil]|uniref:response regulator transcription factor n=1 Tax=Streptomyces sp. VRA16 Mangrove soil TaxID=2817434 RepID=UPI001A9D964E|nr:response regulator transcription factor [Streptomyces sp. VRA16 Mangrove soil]MBO1333961.1 response regulator transcription factor [Streptomyces sp. VRA16 Mangrove soil]
MSPRVPSPVTRATPVTVLVVEDDPDVRLVLTVLFERQGWTVLTSPDGRSALRTLLERNPDVLVLDIGLPELDGWQVLERVRDMTDLPVLMLTAHGHETDRVRGLRAGADDYLTKPFSNNELVARIEALLRRVPTHRREEGAYDDGVLRMDPATRTAEWRGTALDLSLLQFRLLHTLARARGTVLTVPQLLERVWDDPTGQGAERVKFAVLRLRKALLAVDPGADALEAVRGLGYRYRGDRHEGSGPG